MRRSWAGALATSCLMHAGLVGVGAWLLSRAFGGQEHVVEMVHAPNDPERGVELPIVESLSYAAGAPQGPKLDDLPAPELEAVGGMRLASPQLWRAGKGGSPRASVEALNLSDRATAIALNRERATGDQQSQIQRLRTGQARKSWDDRRATPNPMELDFVVTGPGNLLERRPAASWDPARGLRTGAKPSREGSVRGAERTTDPERSSRRVGGRIGANSRLALGVADGSGKPGLHARVITARPPVERARAAVPANQRARPEDTIDSSHQIADAVRSLVHAGGLGGPLGEGPGGEASRAQPGRGGRSGAGATAAASGIGQRAGAALASDSGLGRYYGQLLRQVDWNHAFPDWAVAAGRGGLAVVAVTLDQSGRVSALQLVRPSGISEFDRNLLAAIRRASPYGPLPAAAGSSLRVSIAFDATNPAVGREGGGPGGRHRAERK